MGSTQPLSLHPREAHPNGCPHSSSSQNGRFFRNFFFTSSVTNVLPGLYKRGERGTLSLLPAVVKRCPNAQSLQRPPLSTDHLHLLLPVSPSDVPQDRRGLDDLRDDVRHVVPHDEDDVDRFVFRFFFLSDSITEYSTYLMIFNDYYFLSSPPSHTGMSHMREGTNQFE